MATSLRGNAGSGKEKRGTSPSSSIIKKSPKPSSSSPSDEQSNSPTDSNKPVPNYLKPTISSSHDYSRVPRKPISDTSKPTLNRRRSFERPPPSSQVQRAVRGPPSGTRDIKPLRSTSFSNKSPASSASSSRPTSEKLFARTSSLKDGKVDPQLSRSRSIKRSGLSSSTSTKKEPTSSSSSSTKKAPKSVNSESSVEYENRASVDHLGIEDEFVNIDDHEVQSLPEMSEMPESNKELADPTNIEMEEAVQHIPEAPKEASLEEHHQQHEDKSTFVVDQTVEESADHQPEVEAAGEQTLVEDAGELHQQDEADKKVTEMVEPIEPIVDETKEEEAAAAADVEAEKEEVETEAKDENQTVSSPPADAAPAPAKTQAASAGKKDKQVYNDVIEETATKLRGKKNKVLALAGAFETVISLQDTNKS